MASYQVVPIDGVIRLRLSGTIDLAASRSLLLDVARDAQLRSHGLLIDFRVSKGDMSYRDVHDLIAVLVEHAESFTRRIALLEDYTDRFEKAQFFQAYATERGFKIRAFVDEVAAVSWLEEGEDAG